MGWFLDGKVTAVIGTHTHVQTADERVLPGGTAYLTDVGMTGPHDGVIGVEKAAVLQRFLTGLPARFESASGDPRLHAVVITANDETGRATRIERLSYSMDDLDALSSTAVRRGSGRGTPLMPSLFDLPFDDAEPRREERPRAPQPPPIFTVSELTADIRAALEMGFSDVRVEGEISNCRAWNTGHLYFTLKDAGAQIRAVMFRSAARLLKFKVQDGQHVIARGRAERLRRRRANIRSSASRSSRAGWARSSSPSTS